MKKNLTLYFVKRYLRFDREQPFISLSAGLAFLGIALGVMVLIVAMSIMNGFDKELQRKLSIMNYPLTLVSTNSTTVEQKVMSDLENKFPNYQFSPYIVTSIVAKYAREMRGGFLFGVDFEREKRINQVIGDAFNDQNSSLNKFEVVVGKKFMEDLFLSRDSKITYIFTEIDPSGLVSTPKIKRLNLHSSFHSRLNSYDETYHYTTLEALQKVLGLKGDEYHGIHISTPNPREDLEIILKNLPEGYKIVGWWEQNGNLFSAIEMEKRALFIVLMLIILIASVNIISSLLMTVMNRRGEIALLISMGATEKDVKNIFLYLGVVIGVSGVLSGVIFGFLGIFILENFNIISLPADVYGSSSLPMELSSLDLIFTIIGALFIVIVSSLYPARKASQIDIVKVLKNE